MSAFLLIACAPFTFVLFQSTIKLYATHTVLKRWKLFTCISRLEQNQWMKYGELAIPKPRTQNSDILTPPTSNRLTAVSLLIESCYNARKEDTATATSFKSSFFITHFIVRWPQLIVDCWSCNYSGGFSLGSASEEGAQVPQQFWPRPSTFV